MILSLFRVSGHSMEPTFKAGQILLVSSISYFLNEPKVGDVIVLNNEEKLLLKRILKKDKDAFFVTGDNRDHSRILGPILKEQIAGKVILKLS